MKDPLVSVVMPIHNNDNYVAESIESILRQTFTDFELILIDDGSTDSSNDVIKKYGDPRISIIQNEINMGVAKSLNKAHLASKGDYIVTIGSDDICDRILLEEQVNFMEGNKHIDICGTFGDYLNEDFTLGRGISDEEIKIGMLHGCFILHGGSIYRKSSLMEYNLYYNENFEAAVDYEFFSRASEYLKFQNIPKVLYHVRRHENQISNKRKALQDYNADRVRNKELDKIIPERTDEESKFHCAIAKKDFSSIEKDYFNYITWLDKLKDANKRKAIYNDRIFAKFIERLSSATTKEYFDRIFIFAEHYNMKTLQELFFSNAKPYSFYSNKVRLSITVKCFFHWSKNNYRK